MMVHSRIKKFVHYCLIVAVTVCALALPANAAAPDPEMAGKWRGKAEIPDGPTLEVNLEFYKSEDGEDRLFLFVPEQDAILIVEDLTLGEDSIEFSSEDEGLSYKGTLKRGEKIEGTLTQNEQQIPITFVLDTGNNND